MLIRIEVEVKGQAIIDDDAELGRIIREAAGIVDSHCTSDDLANLTEAIELRDINGNVVGRMEARI